MNKRYEKAEEENFNLTSINKIMSKRILSLESQLENTDKELMKVKGDLKAMKMAITLEFAQNGEVWQRIEDRLNNVGLSLTQVNDKR